MWENNNPLIIPKNSGIFYITSSKGIPFFVKPGEAYYFDTAKWIKLKTLKPIQGKIFHVVISQSGQFSMHIPKISNAIGIHENVPNSFVLTIPLPTQTNMQNDTGPKSHVAPNGKTLLITEPNPALTNTPFCCCGGNEIDLSKNIHGIAACETGKMIAVALDEQFWVWQQLPEETKGTGFWTNLSTDKNFAIDISANHKETSEGKATHGFLKPVQTFTMTTALAPNVPQNSAISYQDLCLFDNPEEGRGICCLTVVLPPSQPYDTIWLYNSVCLFKGYEPHFERYETTIRIYEERGSPARPCLWWTQDGRYAVLVVSQTMIILTRILRVIKILPLSDVFPSHKISLDPEMKGKRVPILVASVAWSSNGQFFVTTSSTGVISAVTRSGQSLRHSLCDLSSFSSSPNEMILCSADSINPSLFIFYTCKKMRLFQFDLSLIPLNFENVMSLPFPHKCVSSLWEPSISIISACNSIDKTDFSKLMYFTEIFNLFPQHSPLRYVIYKCCLDHTQYLLDSNADLFMLFVVRQILRVTGRKVPAYDEVLKQLSYSSNVRDKILFKILQDELDKKDYQLRTLEKNSRIKVYGEDKKPLTELLPPPDGYLINLQDLIPIVKTILFTNDTNLDEIFQDNDSSRLDLHLLLDLTIFLQKFDQMLELSKHPSISKTSVELFKRIVQMHATNALILLRAMIICISADPDDEIEIRTLCVQAIVNILKQKVIDTAPKDGKPLQKVSEYINIEEEFQLFCPDRIEQCNDFSVVLEIGLIAADYINISDYLNENQLNIPDGLLVGIHDLFAILWFVQWRELAISEIARDQPGDATIRLRPFGDFINTKAAAMQLEELGKDAFSPNLFTLYTSHNPDYEQDPLYPDYQKKCIHVIKPFELRRIQSVLMKMRPETEDIPYSGVLLTSVVAHLVPYLRGAIARKLAPFDSGEIIPNELLQFEEFSLMKGPQPKNEIVTIASPGTSPESTSVPTIKSNSESSGEFIPKEVELVKSEKKRKRKPKPKPKPKPRRVSSSSDDTEYHPHRKRPMPFLTFQLNNFRKPVPSSFYTPYTPTQPINPYPYDYFVPYEIALPQTPNSGYNGPIWGADPNDWDAPVKETIKPPPPEPTPPPVQTRVDTGISTSTQKSHAQAVQTEEEHHPKQAQQVKPLVLFVEPPDVHNNFPSDNLVSSDLSDFQDIAPRKPEIYRTDPYPLDRALYLKVEKALNQPTYDVESLDPPLKFIPPKNDDQPKLPSFPSPESSNYQHFSEGIGSDQDNGKELNQNDTNYQKYTTLKKVEKETFLEYRKPTLDDDSLQKDDSWRPQLKSTKRGGPLDRIAENDDFMVGNGQISTKYCQIKEIPKDEFD